MNSIQLCCFFPTFAFMTDRQSVAAQLSGFTIPEEFVPILSAAPVEPTSLSIMFGQSPYAYKDVFNAHYNISTNLWDTSSTIIVPTLVRTAVAAQLVLINGYEAAYLAWQMDYFVQREAQWRFLLADRILL